MELMLNSQTFEGKRLGLVPTCKKSFSNCLNYLQKKRLHPRSRDKTPPPSLIYGNETDPPESLVFVKREFLVEELNKFFPIQKISALNVVQFERLKKCELCGKSFTTNQNLKQHIGFEHEEKIWKCTFSSCNYEKKCTEQNFKRHQKRHQNQHTTKPFVCSNCLKSFQHKSSLKTHQQTVNCSAPNNQNNQSASEMHTGKLLTL